MVFMSQITISKDKSSAFRSPQQKKDIPSWVAPSIAGFWFIGLFLIWNAYFQTEITWVETSKWYLFFALTGTLIPYKFIIKYVWLEYTYWITAHIVGVGPILTGFFLLLNLTFTGQPSSETYQITEVQVPESQEYTIITVKLEDNALEHHPKFRTFDYYQIRYHKSITYVFTEGIWGYRVMEKTEMN